MKLNKTFPYNENQRILHIPESMMIRNMKYEAVYEAKNPKHEKELYKKKLAFLEEIKNQDPHPKEIFASCPVCFWDCDVYWLHWQRNKSTIIERTIRNFYHGDMTGEETMIKSLSLLEQFYTKEEILHEVGYSPDPNVRIWMRKFIYKYYGKQSRISSFKWGTFKGFT